MNLSSADIHILRRLLRPQIKELEKITRAYDLAAKTPHHTPYHKELASLQDLESRLSAK